MRQSHRANRSTDQWRRRTRRSKSAGSPSHARSAASSTVRSELSASRSTTRLTTMRAHSSRRQARGETHKRRDPARSTTTRIPSSASALGTTGICAMEPHLQTHRARRPSTRCQIRRASLRIELKLSRLLAAPPLPAFPTVTRTSSTVTDPVCRVSRSLHECSPGAAKLEKVQRNLRTYRGCRFAVSMASGVDHELRRCLCLTTMVSVFVSRIDAIRH